MEFSSEPVAGVGVADRQREEAKPEGQQDQVQHLDAPSVRCRAVRAHNRCTSLTCIKCTNGSRDSRRRLSASRGICFRDGSDINVIGISYRCSATSARDSDNRGRCACIPQVSIAPKEFGKYRPCPRHRVYEIPISRPSHPSRFSMGNRCICRQQSRLEAAG